MKFGGGVFGGGATIELLIANEKAHRTKRNYGQFSKEKTSFRLDQGGDPSLSIAARLGVLHAGSHTPPDISGQACLP
jgi:hypothetical protein